MQGVKSVYRELEKTHWDRTGPEVTSRITKMVTEGLLSTVLMKTLLYIKDEGPLTDTDTADLLLSLSLNAQTKDQRIREELSRVVYILEEGRTKQIYDLFITWLQKATHRFIWLWPSLWGAQVIPFLVA